MMEYTILKLSKLAGISTRTLRYYDEINILKPARINSSGYRIYGSNEVKKLQQILFFKELGVDLKTIKKIVNNPNFNVISTLENHHNELLEKRKQLDKLIDNVEKTIAESKGEIKMCDKERFEGLKKNIIEENEKNYGKEIREKYGNPTIDASNKKFLNMSNEDFEKFTNLENEIIVKLKEAFKTGNSESKEAQEVAKLHKEWLMYTWSSYSKEAHRGLAEMYIADERFTNYYDSHGKGLAKFLRDSIVAFTTK